MMSSDSNSMKDTDAWFSTEPLKTLSIINNVEDVFLDFKVINSDNSYFFPAIEMHNLLLQRTHNWIESVFKVINIDIYISH